MSLSVSEYAEISPLFIESASNEKPLVDISYEVSSLAVPFDSNLYMFIIPVDVTITT